MSTIDNFVNDIENILAQRGYLIMPRGSVTPENNAKIFFNSVINEDTEESIDYFFLANHRLGTTITFDLVHFGSQNSEQTPSERAASLEVGNQLLLPTTPEKAADIFEEAFHTLGISPKK